MNTDLHKKSCPCFYCAVNERDRYKAALEKMIIPGAGVPCRCGRCYVCIAMDALRGSEKP